MQVERRTTSWRDAKSWVERDPFSFVAPANQVLASDTVEAVEVLSRNEVARRAGVDKRALLRKDPTFSEGEYGFRAFGELIRHLADRNVIALGEGSTRGDPEAFSAPWSRSSRRGGRSRAPVGPEEQGSKRSSRASPKRRSVTGASSSS